VHDLDFIVITGTRRGSSMGWQSGLRELIHPALQQVKSGGLLIVGDSRTGVDRAARELADEEGVCIDVHHAIWDLLGKRAGPVRNSSMAGSAKALLQEGLKGKGFAYPDAQSRGTHDCARKLRAVGLEVEEVRVR
jgi:hypothetical protein